MSEIRFDVIERYRVGDSAGSLAPLDDSHPHGRSTNWSPADGALVGSGPQSPQLGSVVRDHARVWPLYGVLAGGAGGLAAVGATTLTRSGGAAARILPAAAGSIVALGVGAALAHSRNATRTLDDRAHGQDVIVGGGELDAFVAANPRYADAVRSLGLHAGELPESGDSPERYAEMIIDTERGLNIVFDRALGPADLAATSGMPDPHRATPDALKTHLATLRAQEAALRTDGPSGETATAVLLGAAAGAVMGGFLGFRGLAAANPFAGVGTGAAVGAVAGGMLGGLTFGSASEVEARRAAQADEIAGQIDRIDEYLSGA